MRNSEHPPTCVTPFMNGPKVRKWSQNLKILIRGNIYTVDFQCPNRLTLSDTAEITLTLANKNVKN